MNRGLFFTICILGAGLAPLLVSCGADEAVPEGRCLYEVALEQGCLDIPLFKSLTLEVTDSAGLFRGFELSENQPLWEDTVSQGVVTVNMMYRFYSPGVLVEEARYLEIPSEFDDACSLAKNTLVVDCSALPLSEEESAP